MEARRCLLPEPGGLPRPRLLEFGEMLETEGDNANETEPSCPYFRGRPLFRFTEASPDGGGAIPAEESAGEDSTGKGGGTNPAEPPPPGFGFWFGLEPKGELELEKW